MVREMRRPLRVAALFLVAAICAGCVLASQSRIGGGDEPSETKGLIKPFIPQDQGAVVPPGSGPEQPLAQPQAQPPSPPELQAPPPAQNRSGINPAPLPSGRAASPPPKSSAGQWEDQKVRKAAQEILKRYPTAKKVKICYAVKDDEWWVILYDDAGTYYELRQFVWDRDREKLDPHLVLKRIAKSRLQDHLTANEPDRACEVMDPGSFQSTGTKLKANF